MPELWTTPDALACIKLILGESFWCELELERGEEEILAAFAKGLAEIRHAISCCPQSTLGPEGTLPESAHMHAAVRAVRWLKCLAPGKESDEFRQCIAETKEWMADARLCAICYPATKVQSGGAGKITKRKLGSSKKYGRVGGQPARPARHLRR